MKLAVGAALRRHPSVRALARELRARRARGWIVGGALRDGLLGRSAPDVDVAVEADPEVLARALESAGVGTAVPISDAAPRVFRVASRPMLDLAGVEGSGLAEDLARRDFTCNAMAIDLATGDWIDPHGGARDLARRRLRLVRASNVAEDPLRAFRAARFLATHRLVPDRQTREVCTSEAPRLEGVAPERIRTELSRMLESPRVAPAFAWARRAGLLSPALGVEAAPDAWTRSTRILARLDVPASRTPPERRGAVRLAAIAAGLGMGPREAADWLRRRRHGRSEAATVASLLGLARRAGDASTPDERWAWIHDAGPDLPGALLLLEALDPRRRKLAAGLRKLSSRRRKGPRIDGGDVMTWLDLPPGPRVGELLRLARIEALCGRLRTRRQARHFLTERAAGSPSR